MYGAKCNRGRKEIQDMPEEIKKTENDRKVYTYWMGCIGRAAKKMPVDDWGRAEQRLAAKTSSGASEDDRLKELPVVNDFRNHFESSRAYLDQRDPSFKVIPSSAFMNDPDSLKRAECNRVFLQRVWSEQECQQAESQKLDSALLRNIGYTMPIFDLKKWMPAIKYLPANDVRIDPDCKGLFENAKWWAYKEDISLEELKGMSNISALDISILKKRGGSTLTEDELKETDDSDKALYFAATVWHIFARDDAAIRLYDEEDSDELPAKSLVDELKLTTKRRYIQLVDGLLRPLKNIDEWPFELDHNEHILTRLIMNKQPEDLYGYTDYRQMERMDGLSDNVMGYVENDAYFSAIRKYLAADNVQLPNDMTLDNFINDNRRSVLPNMLDEAGNPKLREIAVGQTNAALPQHYTLMHEQAMEASGQAELSSESVADYKDVTAIGVRVQEEKRHQRVNLRLGGPRGYEKSIQEDAVKMLEIAHQFIPRVSKVLVKQQVPIEMEFDVVYEEQEVPIDMPWEDAKIALIKGGKLLKLGVDAIVGPELSQHWQVLGEVPMEEIRLSMSVLVVPGSTRSITQDQRAADLTDMYLNMLWPTMYEPMGRLDLAKRFIEHIGQLKGIDRMDTFLPQESEIKQFLQQQQQQQQQEAQMQQQQMAQEAQAQQQQLQQEQMSADADLQRDGAKTALDMESQQLKGELEQAKGEMQLELMRRKGLQSEA